MKTGRKTSPLKRRNPAQMLHFLEAIKKVLGEEDSQITIRHLFYRLVSLKVIGKTEQAYKGLCKHLAKWRRDGSIDWNAFSDSTRWYIRAPAYDGLYDVLKRTRDNYRRDMWASQRYYVEVWVEKDAIAGIVSGIARSYGVPVYVCRGFSSLTGIFQASEVFREVIENGKKPVIFHLGDFDPSGKVGAEFLERSLRVDFGLLWGIDFRSIAVTEQQIEEFDLPTRPTKKSSHSKNWTGGESVELDAMSTAQIQEIVQRAIIGLIDPGTWEALRKTEEEERKTLDHIASRYRRRAA